MTPSDLYTTLLTSLTNARSVLLSPAWINSLGNESIEVRVAAGNAGNQLQSAILTLSNESLGDIAADMQANEADLTTCTKDLGAALTDVTKVQAVLSKITNVLNVVAKIVPLL